VGFLNAGLAMLTVGYILGVWTACALFRARRRRNESELSTQISMLYEAPIPEVVWISERRS
jgi:hypothetical protein